MSAFTMQSDDKEEQRKQQRRESLKQVINKEEKETPVEAGEEKKVEKSEKKLDNDEKNSYIDKDVKDESDKGEENNEEKQRLQSIIDNTFGGDPYKIAKSWRDSQRSFTQLYNQFNEVKAEQETVNDVLKENPELADLFKKAYRGELKKGENIQNFLNGAGEPQGKPTSPSNESKLSAMDSVSEDTLLKEGYLSKGYLDSLTGEQRQIELQRAQLDYLRKSLPDYLAKEASRKYQEQIAQQEKEAKLKSQREKNAEINKQRYTQGMQKVVDDFGLDFGGGDRELLDEIDKTALYIIDPQNPHVIDEDAVYLAAQKVLKKHGRETSVSSFKQKKEEITEKANNMYDKNSFNTSTRSVEDPSRPKSVADKLRQRRLERYQRDLELRKRK